MLLLEALHGKIFKPQLLFFLKKQYVGYMSKYGIGTCLKQDYDPESSIWSQPITTALILLN